MSLSDAARRGCANKAWRAVAVYTKSEGLRNYPEHVRPYRDFNPENGKWMAGAPFTEDPDTIDEGQRGLSAAARLDTLGASNLTVEADE